jgi:hypothetical protein
MCEAANQYHQQVPALVQEAMDRLAGVTGRQHRLFEYVGADDAERVVVMMGSGSSAAEAVVRHLSAQGQKVGLLKVGARSTEMNRMRLVLFDMNNKILEPRLASKVRILIPVMGQRVAHASLEPRVPAHGCQIGEWLCPVPACQM